MSKGSALNQRVYSNGGEQPGQLGGGKWAYFGSRELLLLSEYSHKGAWHARMLSHEGRPTRQRTVQITPLKSHLNVNQQLSSANYLYGNDPCNIESQVAKE